MPVDTKFNSSFTIYFSQVPIYMQSTYFLLVAISIIIPGPLVSVMDVFESIQACGDTFWSEHLKKNSELDFIFIFIHSHSDRPIIDSCQKMADI